MKMRVGMRRSVWFLKIMVGLLPLSWATVSQGQTTAITSSGLNTEVSHVAGQPNYDITGGTRPGDGTNLFHSFGDLSVGTNDVARFLNDSGLATTNILSRVTGGNPSNILGEINTTNFPGTNLYLINPAGVLFGATATLNVSGSVHVSTADYLRLADGLRFNAVPGPQDALLSQAPIVAFGFLNPNPRPISVNGATLSVNSGQTLSLIGGDVRVSGGTLRAPSGQINLVSLASRGEVRVGLSGEPTVSGFGRLGNVTLSNHTLVGAGSTTGGTVVLRAGKLVVDHSRVDASGTEVGGTISAKARDSVRVTNGQISSDSESGAGGTIAVSAKHVMLVDSQISSSAAPGNGGTIAVDAEHLTLRDSQINSSSGMGFGGTITVAAKHVILRDSQISSIGEQTRGGTITVAAKYVTLGNSRIETDNFGQSGIGGTIDVAAERVTLRNSQIHSDGLTQSSGGRVAVSAKHVTLSDSQIRSNGENDGGTIAVAAKNLTLKNSQMSASCPGFSCIGTGGTINIRTDALDRDARSVIDASSEFGTDGTVTIEPLP